MKNENLRLFDCFAKALKYNQNVFEVYTDDGQYRGNIYTMGDFIGEDINVKDKDDKETDLIKPEHQSHDRP